jgi:tRNA A-37 threonylcarbamoyl transferase component Bud32
MQQALEAVNQAPEAAADLPALAGGFSAFADPVLPREVGRFQVMHRLAVGGMGAVYVAEDRVLQRTVALKMIRAFHLSTEEEKARFQREAEVVARLDHPHIVPVYEAGELDGHPFLAMKLIHGGTLAGRLAQGPLEAREAVRLLAKVAAAVQHAHDKGVLHRDLKPSNILLDAAGEPWLTDFGMAACAQSSGGLTASGTQIGTPQYMSPEQAAGRMRELSPASDVWALGILLYQMLSGQVPYAAETSLAVIHRVVSEPPPRFHPTSMAEKDLAVVIERCLQKAPAERLPSAGLLAEELERWLRGEPVLCKPVSKFRPWRWASLMMALPALAGVTWQLRQPQARQVTPEQHLTPPAEVVAANFGRALVMEGDTLVVGAPRQGSGSAFVYAREAGQWVLQATLQGPEGKAGDEFGRAVALHGSTLVVGAHQDDSAAPDSGAVHVFSREGTAWKPAGLLKAAAPSAQAGFGRAVAIHGDTVVVGSRLEDSSGLRDAGAAYVFVRDGSSWRQQARLISPQPGLRHLFGMDVCVQGDTLIVGADGEGALAMPRRYYNVLQPSIGAAYVFTRSGGDWTLQSRLSPAEEGSGGCFGYSVALAGDTALIGAYRDNNSAATANPDLEARESGAAFVFVRVGGTWQQQAYLKADNLGAGHRFGFDVAVEGDTAVIGAYAENRGATGKFSPEAGAAFVFQRRASAWAQTAYLKAPTTKQFDHFGISVSLSADTLAVGAVGHDVKPSGTGHGWTFRVK